MPEWTLSLWQWLQTASQGQASFVGTLMGSFLGLIALLLGALVNACLNRRRDDRLRREDQGAVATAVKAELSEIHHELLRSSHDLRQQNPGTEHHLVRDVAQSVRVFPEIISKIGLLDPNAIQYIIKAYHAVEHRYGVRLLLLAEGEMQEVEGRQYIKLLSSKLEKIVGINKHATADIEPALKSLEPYTAISWWRWLRTTGCFAGVGLLLALMDGGAGAQQQRNVDSAHFMLPHCKRFLDVPGKGTFTEGVCAGSITTLGFVGQVLNKRFCYPASVTNEQMVRLVVAYIEARPARMHEDFRTLALEALREAWPC